MKKELDGSSILSEGSRGPGLRIGTFSHGLKKDVKPGDLPKLVLPQPQTKSGLSFTSQTQTVVSLSPKGTAGKSGNHFSPERSPKSVTRPGSRPPAKHEPYSRSISPVGQGRGIKSTSPSHADSSKHTQNVTMKSAQTSKSSALTGSQCQSKSSQSQEVDPARLAAAMNYRVPGVPNAKPSASSCSPKSESPPRLRRGRDRERAAKQARSDISA